MTDGGVIAALARYPVTSMRGERVATAGFGTRGVDGDRGWAVYTDDGGIGSGKTTRRFRRVHGLLGSSAALDGGVPVIVAPDGRSARAGTPAADRLVSGVLGRELRLGPEAAVPHHDESPVHVVTTAALREVAGLLGAPVDPARFRANVVLDVDGVGCAEDGWGGRQLALGGEVVVRLGEPMPRCVMVDLDQRGGRHPDRLLRLLGDERGTTFGVQASVEHGGFVRVGDAARLL